MKNHPDLWEFILFNVLANLATITNFIIMWLGTGLLFKKFANIPFRFFVFQYTSQESLGLCGFLSFLAATTAAQIVNYIVQKKWVFRSNVAFSSALPKYIIMVLILVTISAALPAYTQELLLQIGLPEGIVPTIANCINILVQVLISYPSMKFWIMPGNRK